MGWVIAIMLISLALEGPVLLRKKMYRELAYFGILWVLAFVYASLTALRLPLPTVLETLTYLYGKVGFLP